MAAVEVFAEAMHLRDSTVFWFDVLSINHHRADTEYGSDVTDLPHLAALRECRDFFRLFGPRADTLKRGWELFKLENAMRTGKHVYFGCPSGVLACNHPFRSGTCQFGQFHASLSEMVLNFDAKDMMCTVDADRLKILDFFNHQGADTISLFNARLRRWVVGPLLRKAAWNDDADLIRSVCRLPGLRVNSNAHRGGLGETPLHVAAASASLNALRTLIELHMDPNIEDLISESPLHYAAHTGKA